MIISISNSTLEVPLLHFFIESCKNVFIYWYSSNITSIKFRIFIINSTFTLSPEDFGSGKYSIIYTVFLSMLLLKQINDSKEINDKGPKF